MTNPQLTENLLAVIRSLPADDRRWLLRQLEQDNDLAAEPELYSFSDGDAIVAG